MDRRSIAHLCRRKGMKPLSGMLRIVLYNLHPLVKASMLFSLFLILTAVGFGVAGVLVSFVEGIPLAEAAARMTDLASTEGRAAARLGQVCFQLFGFLGAALAFRWLFGKDSVLGFLMRPKGVFFLLGGAVMLAMLPMVDALMRLNEWLIPESSALGQWAMPMQEEAERATQAVLGGGEVSMGWLLVMVGLLPAIAEEFFFRGVIQPQLARAAKNIHVGIWVTAFGFAATHMQLYGFLPRLMLGGLLGYLVVWSGTIWAAVLAHFVNNAVALWATAAVGEWNGVDPVEESSASYPLLAIATAVGLGLIVFLLRNNRWPVIKDRYLTTPHIDIDEWLANRKPSPS